MSSELHLSRTQWREVYPHLDPDKIIDPPTPNELVRVSRRVDALAHLVEDAREVDSLCIVTLWSFNGGKRKKPGCQSSTVSTVSTVVSKLAPVQASGGLRPNALPDFHVCVCLC